MDKIEAQEPLSSEAYQAGCRAGNHHLSPSMNPHSVGSFEYIQWNEGRDKTIRENLPQPVRLRPCIYVPNTTCNCGGRGTCLDVA